MFEDALLHFLQPIVVVVQLLLSILDAEIILCFLTPREGEQCLEIIQLHVVVGSLHGNVLQLTYLAADKSLNLFRQLYFGDSFAQFNNVLILASSQLVLDILNLLLKEILLLLLVQFLVCLILNVALEAGKLHLAPQHLHQAIRALIEAVLLNQLVLIRKGKRHIRTDEVGQEHWIVDIAHGKNGIFARWFGQAQELGGCFLTSTHQHLKLLVIGNRQFVVQSSHATTPVGIDTQDFIQVYARKALQNDGSRAIWQREGTDDTRSHTRPVEILYTRNVHRSIQLAENANHFVVLGGVVNQMERTLASYIDLRHHSREQHHISQRKNGQGGGHAFVEERGNIAFIICYKREGAITDFIFIHCRF